MSAAWESHLKSGTSDELFGKAIDCCEGYTPDCIQHERCQLDGECFDNSPNLVAARMIESQLLGDQRMGVEFAYLRQCVDLLRNDGIAI